VLKIDRTFVLRCLHDERDAAIARSLVDLGRRLGLHVIAEGVERAEVWDLLAGWGCHEAQGHYLGRPMSGADLRTWLDRLSGHAGPVSEPRIWAPGRR
jgi:EAL domain-containing protein (putative c-di-GMP-specific phosphodiesterase class I)